jgi:hypothetical protein
MTQYDNTNQGILSRNDRKEADTHPDFKGQINVEGREYWLAGYVKERKDGTGKFFSLRVKPKESNSPLVQQAEPRKQAQARADDDIPF